MIADLSPWFGYLPRWVASVASLLPLAVTLLLIVANLVLSIQLFRRSGQAISALPLAFMQLMLFTLLFFQIGCHLGSENYTWDEPPGFWNWIGFALAHAFRAGDMIDGLEASGYKIQTIHSHSHLVAVAVIAYHLVIDVFLIEIAMQWVERGKKALLKRKTLRTNLRLCRRILGGCLVVSCVATAFWAGWEPSDLVLWPLHNILAVADFTDVFDIYEIRLHQVPNDAWTTTLAIVFRVLTAIVLADLLNRISQSFRRRWLARFAMSLEALEDIKTHHSNPETRRWATERIESLQSTDNQRVAPSRWISQVIRMGKGRGGMDFCVANAAHHLLPTSVGVGRRASCENCNGSAVRSNRISTDGFAENGTSRGFSVANPRSWVSFRPTETATTHY